MTRFARIAAGLAVLAFAAACSSSTGPSDPLVGNWALTFHQTGTVDTGSTLTPAPFVFSVSKVDTTYSISFHNLVWTGPNAIGMIDTYQPYSSGTYITADTLSLVAHDTLQIACYLSVQGRITGSTVTGTALAFGQLCVPDTWSFTGTKQ